MAITPYQQVYADVIAIAFEELQSIQPARQVPG
jgi:hypothetical protein